MQINLNLIKASVQFKLIKVQEKLLKSKQAKVQGNKHTENTLSTAEQYFIIKLAQ